MPESHHYSHIRRLIVLCVSVVAGQQLYTAIFALTLMLLLCSMKIETCMCSVTPSADDQELPSHKIISLKMLICRLPTRVTTKYNCYAAPTHHTTCSHLTPNALHLSGR